MAWQSTGVSARTQRLPDNWELLRIRVLRRDAYKCQSPHLDGRPGKCLRPANQVDHIQAGDNHDMSNLQSLCRDHHAKKSSAEGAAARRANGFRSTRRDAEPHPLARLQRHN